MSPAIVIYRLSEETVERLKEDLSSSDVVSSADYIVTSDEEEACSVTTKNSLQLLVVGTSESDRKFADKMKSINNKLVVLSFGMFTIKEQPKHPFNGFVTNASKENSFKRSLVRLMEEFTFQRQRLSNA